ncbi:MAG TPA: hypothetical protein EYQ84_01905 [Nitrospinaceae bacterium]|jgi:hypothetical protein|nr:hypothetical protein [Nitrospinaceae bacterium]HIL27220.1 hypothetical protein [Nitrospinaceae bacterium]
MGTTEPKHEKNFQLFQRIKLFGSKYKGEIGLGVLILYVFLLGLGTVGEVWDVEWILDLPLFRPPGKY